MSTLAAISGAFADFRTVKGRKVCQLVVEIPIEQADEALRALGGVPQPHSERWVAIARLKETPADTLAGQDGEEKPSGMPEGVRPTSSPSASKKAWADLPASQQAAIRCGEASFMRFLESRYGACGGEDAAAIVRELCWVPSRKELDTNSAARGLWRQIDTDYLVWSGKLAEPR